MVKVKICGITNLEDALWAAYCGADVLGFNFVKGTPRFIAPEDARIIRNQLVPMVFAAGIFANEKLEEVERIARCCRLHYVQLHGDESPHYCSLVKNAEVIKAFRVSEIGDLRQLQNYRVAAYLLDAKVRGKFGGTGQRIDPEIAACARPSGPVVLAGGLNPDNVAEAVKTAKPYAVDSAGGVEKGPGVKSKELVMKFIHNAKCAPMEDCI